MRRRRHTLQVSTFPFLAVLLCAMGSLILVLLVMDRRSKLAAQARAAHALVQLREQAERDRADRERQRGEARRAWERRRDALHARLLAQKRDLEARSEEVRRQLAEAAARLLAERDDLTDRRRQVQAGQDRIRAVEATLSGSREGSRAAARRSAAARGALEKMTADLALLERALQELKAARERDRMTYSVVPYRGRRGENRRPLYVECTATGVIFHPDRLQVVVSREPERIHAEVERRTREQRQLFPDTAVVGRKPYLMLLVRPDGIGTYYLFQSALRDVPLEFGYEMVDADWILDFPPDDRPSSHPWMTAASPAAGRPATGPAPSQLAPPRGVGFFPLQYRAVQGARGAGPATAGTGAAPFAGPPGGSPPPGPFAGPGGLGGPPGGGPVPGLASAGSLPAVGPGGSRPGGAATPGPGGNGPPGLGPPRASGPGVVLGGTGGLGDGSGTTGVPGLGRHGGTGAIGGSLGGPPPGGELPGPGGNGTGEPSAGPVTAGPRVAPPGLGLDSGLGGPGTSAAGPDGGPVSGGPAGAAPRTVLSAGPRAARGPAAGLIRPLTGPAGAIGRRTGTGGPDGQGGPGGSGGATEELEVPPLLPPEPGRVIAQGTPGGPGGTGPPAPPGYRPPPRQPGEPPPPTEPPPEDAVPGKRRRSGGAPAPGGGSSEDGVVNRLGPPAPVAPPPERRPPPRPARLRGNRDLVVFLECQADAVVLYPSRRRFPLVEVLAPGNPLAEAVRQAVARRQALVRPGDPPLRPQVRFLVRPENLRTFHLAYPTLDALRVPTRRQNLEPEDDVATLTAGP